MTIRRRTTVFFFVVIGCAAPALAGDMVVDGTVATTGGWYEFADGSTQTSAAYPRWAQVAVVDIQGRGDYTDPATAMAALPAWCGTPGLLNPCLVKILPGWYDVGTSNVVMQPHVDIEGSGRDVTFSRAASSAAVVYGANNAELRSLSVVNEGDGSSPQGIAIEDSINFPRITAVDVVVQGANTQNTGIVIADSRAMIDSLRVWTWEGDTGLGIGIANSTGELRNVEVVVYQTSGEEATGIDYTDGSYAALRDSRVIVQGGHWSHGIRSESSSPQISGVRVLVESDAQGYGFVNDDSVAQLTDSSLYITSGGAACGLDTRNAGVSKFTEVRIDSITVGSGETVGVNSGESGQVRLEQVDIAATGGSTAYGVRNWGPSETTLVNVTAEASAASLYNYGVANRETAQITATNLIVEALGVSGSNYGVLNQDGAQITATNLVASAYGGTGNYGVLNAGTGGTVTLDRSSVTGANSSVRNDSSSADFFVGTSKLNGPVSTHLTCFGNYDATYAAVVCP
jgi:hypothetical protein